MKLLILVLSYNSGVFREFMDAQFRTWCTLHPYTVDVIFYYGDTGKVSQEMDGMHNSELQVNYPDDYNLMHWKFKLALDAIDYHKYDLIFRTNSCSYIVKERILKVAETLPKTKCYAGWCNGTWISGAGIFFSPDVLDILKEELTPARHGAEDVLIGEMLAGRIEMIDDKSRTDAEVDGFKSYEGYHFRAKTSNDVNDRHRDVQSLLKCHNHFR